MTFFSSWVIGLGVARDMVADAMLIKNPSGSPAFLAGLKAGSAV
jgi:hypothetical protein